MADREIMSYEQYLADVKNGIVTDAGNSPARFGELKRGLPGITGTALSNVLKELEADGFVRREQFNEIPPHVEYSLTEKGADLQPVFYQMMLWGFAHEEA